MDSKSSHKWTKQSVWFPFVVFIFSLTVAVTHICKYFTRFASSLFYVCLFWMCNVHAMNKHNNGQQQLTNEKKTDSDNQTGLEFWILNTMDGRWMNAVSLYFVCILTIIMYNGHCDLRAWSLYFNFQFTVEQRKRLFFSFYMWHLSILL